MATSFSNLQTNFIQHFYVRIRVDVKWCDVKLKLIIKKWIGFDHLAISHIIIIITNIYKDLYWHS